MTKRFVHDRDSLQERLISHAIEIIRTDGFDKVTIRALAKKAECAIGMVYKIFKGIDDLMICVNTRTLNKLYEEAKHLVEDGDQSDNVAYALAHHYITFQSENYKLWSALFDYNYSEGFAFTEDYMFQLGQIFALLENALMPLLNNDEMKAKVTSRVIWAGVHGICSLSARGTLGRANIESDRMLIDTLVLSCLNQAKSDL